MESNFEYYVSYCVVKGSATNPFGHSYLTFSRLDKNQGENARCEVFDAIGFYGDPHEPNQTIQRAIFPARLIGPGHLKREHLRYIVSDGYYFHEHRTWQASKQQIDEIIAGIEKDRGEKFEERSFAREKELWDHIIKLRENKDKEALAKINRADELDTQASGGPYFNLFKRSCMTDAKCRLNEVGINTMRMKKFVIDVPGMTSGPLDKMVLTYEDGKVYWKSPLIVTPNCHLNELPTELQHQLNRMRVFSLLHEAVNQAQYMFSVKVKDLDSKGKKCDVLKETQTALIVLFDEMSALSPYPNKITIAKNKAFEKQLDQIFINCQSKLDKKDADRSFVRFVRTVMDALSQFIKGAAAYFGKQGFNIELSIFGFANVVENQWLEARKKVASVVGRI